MNEAGAPRLRSPAGARAPSQPSRGAGGSDAAIEDRTQFGE